MGWVKLAARYNVAQMLEREGLQIALRDRQAHRHSRVSLPARAGATIRCFSKADVELGGTDQLFNLIVGRDIMPAFGLEPQVVMTTPLLEGLDGVEKMSKSLGNYIAVDDAPAEMFGKVMSISDELMWRYFTLLTDRTPAEVLALQQQVKAGTCIRRTRRSCSRRPSSRIFTAPGRRPCRRRVRAAVREEGDRRGCVAGRHRLTRRRWLEAPRQYHGRVRPGDVGERSGAEDRPGGRSPQRQPVDGLENADRSRAGRIHAGGGPQGRAGNRFPVTRRRTGSESTIGGPRGSSLRL